MKNKELIFGVLLIIAFLIFSFIYNNYSIQNYFQPNVDLNTPTYQIDNSNKTIIGNTMFKIFDNFQGEVNKTKL